MTLQERKDLVLVIIVILTTFFAGFKFGETRDQQIPNQITNAAPQPSMPSKGEPHFVPTR